MYKAIVIITFFTIGLLECMSINSCLRDTIPQDTTARQLREVVVTASNVSHRGLQDSYVVTKDMCRGIKNAGELLGKLNGVYYNPLTTDISYLASKNIIILVDSVPKDREYVKSLRPYRFDHITIVNNPSGQYSGYEAVINLHTRPDYDGYEFNAFANIGVRPDKSNGKGNKIHRLMARSEYTYTNDKLTVAAFASYSRDKSANSNYFSKEYKLNNLIEKTLVSNEPTHIYKSDDAKFNLSADYTLNSHNILSVIWQITPSKSDNDERQTILFGDPAQKLDTIRYTQGIRTRNSLGNNVALYYRGTFNLWNIYVVASYNHYSSDWSRNVWRSNGYSLKDDRYMKFNYFWGGFDLSRSTANRKWFFNLSEYATLSNTTLERPETGKLLGTNQVFRNQMLVSSQFVPSDKLSVGANVGFNIDKNTEQGESKTYVSPRLGAWISYYPSNKFIARLNYLIWSTSPLLSQLNSYGQFEDSLVYRVGNPWLAPEVNHNVSLTLSLFNHLVLKGSYFKMHNYIYDIASTANGLRPDNITGPYIIYNYKNGKREAFTADISYSINFKKYWTASAEVSFKHISATFGQFSKSRCYIEYSWYIMYKNATKDLTLTLSSSFDNKAFVMPQEFGWGGKDIYAIGCSKQLFNKTLEIGFVYYLPLHISKGIRKTKMESQGLDVMQHYFNRDTMNNSFILSISYRLQGGKTVKKYQHTINSIQ